MLLLHRPLLASPSHHVRAAVGGTFTLHPCGHFKQVRRVTTKELDEAKRGRERVVVLGSGWGGFPLASRLDPRKYQALVISPRSYFVFTPLLASCSVGTLEFRTALEPVRRRAKEIEFFEGWADDIDFHRKVVTVEDAVLDSHSHTALTDEDQHGEGGMRQGRLDQKAKQGELFNVSYDKLVISVGCYSQTFGTKGVKENAFFLKDVGDARNIRKRILQCFELASLPRTSEAVKKQLLNFAVVGGGPTGIEFSAELHDLTRDDLPRLYPSLAQYVRITVYDVAPKVLSMFDSKLSEYAMSNFRREGIQIKTEHHVEELRKGLPKSSSDTSRTRDLDSGFTLKTKEEGEVGVGMCVWSTGLMMNPFVEKTLARSWSPPVNTVSTTDPNVLASDNVAWTVKKDQKSGAIITNDRLQVKIVSANKPDGEPDEAVMKDVFAIGDVATTENTSLPATAQVANQKGIWLAKTLNKGRIDTATFNFKNMGVMAYIGNWNAIMQGGNNTDIKGRAAWILWRGAYMTKAVSWRNKLLIPTYWFINWLFGRDISRF
ncbi:MAG: hypothetical protein M1833_004205 [Piccolia ochrophora]|nr:MAG: hypothetical protein M1833_004205 [Piccolia ochrophora]